MSRAYFLILIPAVLVGVGYVILLRRISVPIHIGPFLGAAAAAISAILVVRHYQKRKPRRRSNS